MPKLKFKTNSICTVWTPIPLGIEVSWDDLAECLSLSMVNFHSVMIIRECLNKLVLNGLQNYGTNAEGILNENSTGFKSVLGLAFRNYLLFAH